jgi:Carboxypeptidase regulatory-like domain
MPTRLQILAVVAAAFLGLALPLKADVTGTILGTAVDQSGAAVPGATVTLRNSSTGLTRTTTTATDGGYEFLAVPVGEDYVVEVEAKGFRKAAETGLKLLVNQRYHADFTLVVGAATQAVEVSAQAAQVETTSTQLGDVIDDKKMTSLPLNGRSYLDLMGLQAGVVPISSDQASNGGTTTDRPVSGILQAGNVSVNGQREAANSFLVNGGDVEEGRNNGASVIPTLDSIAEFRLLTNSFDAEYGRFSGGIVNAITKSGTNDFHGDGFEFLRNTDLDTRGFFDPERGVFQRNQFGGTLGGPILKNRLFFFIDYQGTRQRQGISSGNVPVPSLLEKTGNFSDLATTGYTPINGTVSGDNNPADGTLPTVLSQRLGYPVTAGEKYWFSGCTSNTQCVFPGANGAIIPQAAWNPVALATLQFFPDPTGNSGGTPIFSSAAQEQKVQDDKFGVHIDLNNQRTGLWSFYYYFDNTTVVNPYPAFTSNVPGFPAMTPSRAQQFTMSNTHTFSPTAVNEARFNYTRSALINNVPVGGLGSITNFGYTEGGLGIIPSSTLFEGVAPIGLNNTGTSFGLPDGTTGQFNNTYQVADNFSKISGRHTVKFGGEIRYLQINERNTYAQNGYFTFPGSETGNDFADYLIGAVPGGNFIQSSKQFLDSRTKYFGLYGQDTFKVRSNLTLNYGLRWEASMPWYDTENKIQTFVAGEQSHVYPDAPRGWVFPGDPGIPPTLAPTRWDNFGPRVGLAYSPNASDGFWGKVFGGPGRTSIRAAAGIYYTSIEDLTLFVEVGDAPFGLFYVSPDPVYLQEPYKSYTSAGGPGQRFPFTIPPPGATGIWPQYLPISGSPVYQHSNVLPYAEHFNFTIQRQISNSMVLTMGYVGTNGVHLIAQQNWNPGSASLCLSLPGCGPFGEDAAYTNSAGQTVVGTRPYSVTSGVGLSMGLPDFGSNTYESTMAQSSYNALQVSFEKRAGELRLLGAYTYSKALDNSSGFNDQINPFYPGLSRSLSSFDLTHNFVVSYTYDLPLARLSSSSSGFVHGFLSGWMLSGITRFTTGLPITLSTNDDMSLCGCSGLDRPNYNDQPITIFNPRNTADHTYFDTAPFSLETEGVPGNANRRFFHGPGLNNWDFGLQKNTQIKERNSLQFRIEFFNIFNHAQFENPTGTINLSTFGVVTGARPGRIGQAAVKFTF